MKEQQRIEIAELMQMLEINKNRLDSWQYKKFQEEVNRKIWQIRNRI